MKLKGQLPADDVARSVPREGWVSRSGMSLNLKEEFPPVSRRIDAVCGKSHIEAGWRVRIFARGPRNSGDDPSA